MGQPQASVPVSREAANGEKAVALSPPRCLGIASSGLRTTREASRFVNAVIVDALTETIDCPKARVCLGGVGRMVQLAQLEAAHQAPVVLLREPTQEDPKDRRRQELLAELAALEKEAC